LKKENILQFVGNHVQLVKKDHFVIDGVILDLYDDSLIFKTKRQTALISLDIISEIRVSNYIKEEK
jgi:hypothetical protein